MSAHRPVQGPWSWCAQNSDWEKRQNTDARQFSFNAVPIGDYSVSVAGAGLHNRATVEITSGFCTVSTFNCALQC